MAGKNSGKIVFIFFLLAFIIRIIFVFSLKTKFYFDDEYEYWKIVNNFITGKGLIVSETLKAYRPPLYPLFLVLFAKLNTGITGIRIVQALLSSVSCIFIYFLARKVFNEKIAIFSLAISSVYPFFIFYSGFLLTETLFIFLVICCIYAFIKLAESRVSPVYGFIPGIFAGLAGLCRPTMELFFPFCLLFIILSKASCVVKFKKIVFAMAGFIIILTPWIIRNFIVLGSFVPGTTMGGAVFWEGNNPYSDGGPCRYFPEGVWQIEESKRDQVFYKLTIDCIKQNPKRFAWLLWNKFIRFWNVVPNASEYTKTIYRIISVFSFGLMLPFFVLGIFVSPRNLNTLFLTGMIVFFTVFHMIFLASIRYRVAIEPFVIMFASSGFLWIFNQLHCQRKT